MALDTATWPGFVILANDEDLGYTDISGDLPSLGTTNLNAIWAACADEIWAVGQNAGIWHKSGGTWAKDTSHPFGGTQMRSVWGPDCDTIFVCGNAGKIATWTSGGGWGSLHTTPTTDTMKSIHGIDDQTLWCCGNNDEMWFTTNGGSSWAAQGTPFGNSENIQCVRAISATEAIACGQDGTIITTINAGSTWIEDTTPNTATANWLWFSESRDNDGFPDEIWVGQNGGTILFYDGTSWTEQVDLGVDDINGIIGTNANNILACGGNGVFKVWLYNGTTWTEILSTGSDPGNAVAWAPGMRPHVTGDDGQIYESDAVFDDDGDEILNMPLPQQPEQPGVYIVDGEKPSGTELDIELKGSHTNEWAGEEKRITDLLIDTGAVDGQYRYYRGFLHMEAIAGNDISPVLDRVRLSFSS